MTNIVVEALKGRVIELKINQDHMLKAIKYLSEQLEEINNNAKGEKNDIRDILERQAITGPIIVKNSDDILLIKKAKEENTLAIKNVVEKIDSIDKELERTKNTRNVKKETDKNKLKAVNVENTVDCELCEKTFGKYVDLEKHIKTCHEKHRTFKCDQCEKAFVLMWRLKRHMRLHTQESIKHCHYFNSDQICPYEA